MTRLHFWLTVLDVADRIRAPRCVYLWFVRRCSNATVWSPGVKCGEGVPF